MVLRGVLLDEHLNQLRHIFEAFAQRWQLDGEDVQAIVEVGAQQTIVHRLFDIAVGGRQYPHVDRNLRDPANPAHAPFFDYAKQLGLVLESADANLREREIPATLHGSLMARLDRLGPAKEVIQIGAVLGGEFSYELQHAVHSIAEPDLQHALNSLADAELIYVRGIPPEASYQFKHELIRNAAYEALLRSRRKELHRAVARALTSEFAQHAEAEPALLAYHLTEAGDSDRAAAAWQRAADHSAVRGSFVEAVNHYSRAIEVLLTTPDSDTRKEREMVLLISLGSVLSPTKGLASREVESVFLRARELGERLGHRRSAAILGLWQICLTRGRLAAALSLAEQRLEIAQREGAPLSLCWGHLAVGATLLHQGMLAGSLTQSADCG